VSASRAVVPNVAPGQRVAYYDSDVMRVRFVTVRAIGGVDSTFPGEVRVDDGAPDNPDLRFNGYTFAAVVSATKLTVVP
jgi:hypothetical protein